MYLPIGGGAEGRGGSTSGKMDSVELAARRAAPWGGPVARKGSEELGMRSEEWWCGAQLIKRRQYR